MSYETVRYLLADWSENLWALNNGATDEASQKELRKSFEKQYFGDGTRSLSSAQKVSESSFMYAAYGMAFAPNKVGEALSNSKLFCAWRNSVQKNALQQHYNFFTACLRQAIAQHGEAAAVAQFPVSVVYSDGNELIKTFAELNFRPAAVDAGTIARLIRQSRGGSNPPSPKL